MNLDGYVRLTLGLAVLTLVIFIICFCILVTHLSNLQGWKRRDQREGWFWNIRHSQDSVRIIHTQARMDIFQDRYRKPSILELITNDVISDIICVCLP